MIKKVDRNEIRVQRHNRLRKSHKHPISGTPECPRLDVYRSTGHIYAQVIDDVNGVTLCSSSTIAKDIKGLEGLTKVEQAKKVGEAVAKKAIKKGINEVIFDRGGYLYTGRVKALADAAREAGLKF